MTEILFYHLQGQPLERVLPALLAKTLARGWRAVVEATSAERVAALDEHLWTYADDSFLPHGLATEADAAEEPIVLAIDAVNPNGAQVRFLVDGAVVPDDPSGYARIVLIFDGADDAALARARAEWKKAKAHGHDATYWRQNEAGTWEKQA